MPAQMEFQIGVPAQIGRIEVPAQLVRIGASTQRMAELEVRTKKMSGLGVRTE